MQHRSGSVVSFVTSTYVPLLRLWLAQSRSFMESDPVVYAMDDEAAVAASGLGRMRLARPPAALGGSSLDGFWAQRLRLIEAHARDAGDIVHSDLDAFWLDNPSETLDSVDADFVFSTEMGLPREITDQRGFVLCCGFFLMRSTAAAAAFMQPWKEATSRLKDDQIALNLILDRSSQAWREDGHGRRVLETMQGSGRTLRVAALPYRQFTRAHAFEAGEGVKIAHAFLEKCWQEELVRLYALLLEKRGRFDPASGATNPDLAGGKPRDRAALRALDELKVDPERSEDAQLLALRGALQLRFGQERAAFMALDRALTLTPGLGAEYHLDLANAAMALGESKRARVAIAQAVPQLRSEKVALEAARFAVSAGNWRAAARSTMAAAVMVARPSRLGALLASRRVKRLRRIALARGLPRGAEPGP